MEEKVEKRGGKRENAGRKKRDKDVKPILLNLELALFDKIYVFSKIIRTFAV